MSNERCFCVLSCVNWSSNHFVWSHLAQQQHQHKQKHTHTRVLQCIQTQTMKERKCERERNPNSFMTPIWWLLLILLFAHLHELRCVTSLSVSVVKQQHIVASCYQSHLFDDVNESDGFFICCLLIDNVCCCL